MSGDGTAAQGLDPGKDRIDHYGREHALFFLETIVPGTKTYFAKTGEVDREWWTVDVNGLIVGRVASEIAVLLMGKHRPTYTPNVDSGDFVIVTNVEKLKFTGNKLDQKMYTWYTGYPGLRSETAQARFHRKPDQVLRDAVRRMLPKNRLGRQMLGKLKIYVGAEHPHQAQNPKTFESAAGK